MSRLGSSVWLLGAGFPQSLGAPLLKGLFLPRGQVEIESFYPTENYRNLAFDVGQVQSLYQVGHKKAHWQNAEQFLAYVDDGCRAGVESKGLLLTQLLQQAVRAYHDENLPGEWLDPDLWARLNFGLDRRVRRALAAECTQFSVEANVQSELWSPYVRWVESLNAGIDTIIGFNYDQAVELADVGRKVEVVRPGQPLPKDKIPYLKLHGSADWILSGNEKKALDVRSAGSVMKALKGKSTIAIAAPGASKAQFCETYLDSLWQEAEKVLGTARYVNLVGYSFPATDPRAQHRLLEAMRKYEGGKPREIHVVLGDDINSPSSQRMLALLKSVGGGRQLTINGIRFEKPGRKDLIIRQHPVFAQDYILRYKNYEG